MNLFLYSNREKYLYAFAVCRRNISPLLLMLLSKMGRGAFRLNASDFALCDNLRTDDFLQHELSAVKYHFFLGIVSVWGLLKPSTRYFAIYQRQCKSSWCNWGGSLFIIIQTFLMIPLCVTFCLVNGLISHTTTALYFIHIHMVGVKQALAFRIPILCQGHYKKIMVRC